MEGPERVGVTVVLAEPGEQRVVALEVERGTTARAAAERSGLLAGRDHPDHDRLGLAVFGTLVTDDHQLEAGDRVEILRPLGEDPRARRRRLARAGCTMDGRSPGGR